MTIVNSTDLIKNLNYFNRTGASPSSIYILNKSTNITSTFVIDLFTSLNYYDTLTFTVSNGYFLQDIFYYCKILDSNNDVIYKDLIFCTDQENYTINENKYKEHTTTNEYKIYR